MIFFRPGLNIIAPAFFVFLIATALMFAFRAFFLKLGGFDDDEGASNTTRQTIETE